MQPMPKPLLLSMQSVFPHVAMPRPRVAFSRLPVQPDIEGWLIASSASLTMQHQALRKWRLLVRCSSALRTKGGFGRPDAKPTPLRCAISSMVWLDSSCTDADRKVLALQRLYLFSDNSDVDPADACDLKGSPVNNSCQPAARPEARHVELIRYMPKCDRMPVLAKILDDASLLHLGHLG